MAIQRAGVTGVPALPAAPAITAGPALSTRETTNRPFVELGVMFGQALGGREPVMQALTNLQNIGGEHGCDAIIAVKLLHYPTSAGPAVVAYGTGVRFLPQPVEAPEDGAGQAAASGVDGAVAAAGAPDGSGGAGAQGAPGTTGL